MSKYDIRPQLEWQNRIVNAQIRYSAQLECQNRILNVKIRYMPHFECLNRILSLKNTIFGLNLNVQIRYSASVRTSK